MMAAFAANDRQSVLFRLIRKLPNRFARLMPREQPAGFSVAVFGTREIVLPSGWCFSGREDPYVP